MDKSITTPESKPLENCKVEIQSSEGELYQLQSKIEDGKLKLEFSLVNTISPISYISLYSYDGLKDINKFFTLYDSCEDVYAFLNDIFQNKSNNLALEIEGKNLLLSFQPFEKYGKILFKIPQKDEDLHETVQRLCKGINQLKKENKEMKEEIEKKGEIIAQMKESIDKMSSEIKNLKNLNIGPKEPAKYDY